MIIENIIFDLDGTLIDSFPGIDYSINLALNAVLPGTIIPDLKRRIGPPINKILQGALKPFDDRST